MSVEVRVVDARTGVSSCIALEDAEGCVRFWARGGHVETHGRFKKPWLPTAALTLLPLGATPTDPSVHGLRKRCERLFGVKEQNQVLLSGPPFAKLSSRRPVPAQVGPDTTVYVFDKAMWSGDALPARGDAGNRAIAHVTEPTWTSDDARGADDEMDRLSTDIRMAASYAEELVAERAARCRAAIEDCDRAKHLHGSAQAAVSTARVYLDSVRSRASKFAEDTARAERRFGPLLHHFDSVLDRLAKINLHPLLQTEHKRTLRDALPAEKLRERRTLCQAELGKLASRRATFEDHAGALTQAVEGMEGLRPPETHDLRARAAEDLEQCMDPEEGEEGAEGAEWTPPSLAPVRQIMGEHRQDTARHEEASQLPRTGGGMRAILVSRARQTVRLLRDKADELAQARDEAASTASAADDTRDRAATDARALIRNVSRVQGELRRLDHLVAAHCERLQHLERSAVYLEHADRLPHAYAHCVVEVIRRTLWEQYYWSKVREFHRKAQRWRAEEKERRQRLLAMHTLPNGLIPGLEAKPAVAGTYYRKSEATVPPIQYEAEHIDPLLPFLQVPEEQPPAGDAAAAVSALKSYPGGEGSAPSPGPDTPSATAAGGVGEESSSSSAKSPRGEASPAAQGDNLERVLRAADSTMDTYNARPGGESAPASEAASQDASSRVHASQGTPAPASAPLDSSSQPSPAVFAPSSAAVDTSARSSGAGAAAGAASELPAMPEHGQAQGQAAAASGSTAGSHSGSARAGAVSSAATPGMEKYLAALELQNATLRTELSSALLMLYDRLDASVDGSGRSASESGGGGAGETLSSLRGAINSLVQLMGPPQQQLSGGTPFSGARDGSEGGREGEGEADGEAQQQVHQSAAPTAQSLATMALESTEQAAEEGGGSESTASLARALRGAVEAQRAHMRALAEARERAGHDSGQEGRHPMPAVAVGERAGSDTQGGGAPALDHGGGATAEGEGEGGQEEGEEGEGEEGAAAGTSLDRAARREFEVGPWLRARVGELRARVQSLTTQVHEVSEERTGPREGPLEVDDSGASDACEGRGSRSNESSGDDASPTGEQLLLVGPSPAPQEAVEAAGPESGGPRAAALIGMPSVESQVEHLSHDVERTIAAYCRLGDRLQRCRANCLAFRAFEIDDMAMFTNQQREVGEYPIYRAMHSGAPHHYLDPEAMTEQVLRCESLPVLAISPASPAPLPPISDRPARVVGRIIKVQELVLQEGWSPPYPDLQLGDRFALLLATDVRPYSEDDDNIR